jgi:Zn-dependent peptidase ImmA (M78 family)/transcriptional regulator with XRE-family HTH domain
MARLEEVPATEIGERLRIARTTAGKTQDEVSNQIAVSRPTLVAIERGQRKVRADELEKLSRLYGVSVNRLLAKDAVHVDLQAKFRKQGQNDSAIDSAIALLSQLASASVELERILGLTFSPNYPPGQQILPGPIDRQAEEAALSFRYRLGLGLAPISDIVSLLEQEVGIRIFVRKLASSISGLFAYDPAVGACILLNANHPWERRALTAAHETGHFVSSRLVVDVVETDKKAVTQDERFATAFSLALLMPASALRRRFSEILEVDNRFTPRHLVLMAHTFHVSPEAMCRQLERLEIMPAGTYDSIRERGFNKDFISGMFGDPAPRPPTLPVSLRLAQLASSVYRRGLVSEGQLSRMLSLDRAELREILDRFGGDGSDEVQIPLD